MDSTMGISIPSRADFVFSPASSGTKQSTVVVFTDGFKYHKDIIDADTNKRLAIRDSCGFPVWSLTWKDVQEHLTGAQHTDGIQTLNPENMPGTKDFERVLQKNHLNDWKIKNYSSFDLLMRYLADPLADEHFATYACGYKKINGNRMVTA